MYIADGIAYPGEKEPEVKVCGIRPLPDHKSWLRFTTGEAKIFDFRPLLKNAAFKPLSDIKIFNAVYLDHGVPVWENGNIDISPQYLYEHSISSQDIV